MSTQSEYIESRERFKVDQATDRAYIEVCERDEDTSDAQTWAGIAFSVINDALGDELGPPKVTSAYHTAIASTLRYIAECMESERADQLSECDSLDASEHLNCTYCPPM